MSESTRLVARRDQINARLTRLRNAETAKERKRETRRKILGGAWLIERAKAEPEIEKWFRKGMDSYLTRPRDRALFGLEPLDSPGE